MAGTASSGNAHEGNFSLALSARWTITWFFPIVLLLSNAISYLLNFSLSYPCYFHYYKSKSFTNIMFDCYLFSDVFCGTLHCQNGLDKPIVDGGVTHINMQVQLSFWSCHCHFENLTTREWSKRSTWNARSWLGGWIWWPDRSFLITTTITKKNAAQRVMKMTVVTMMRMLCWSWG